MPRRVADEELSVDDFLASVPADTTERAASDGELETPDVKRIRLTWKNRLGERWTLDAGASDVIITGDDIDGPIKIQCPHYHSIRNLLGIGIDLSEAKDFIAAWRRLSREFVGGGYLDCITYRRFEYADGIFHDVLMEEIDKVAPIERRALTGSVRGERLVDMAVDLAMAALALMDLREGAGLFKEESQAPASSGGAMDVYEAAARTCKRRRP